MPKPKDKIKKWTDPKSRDIFTRIIEDVYKKIGKSEDASKDQYLDLSKGLSVLKDDLEKKTTPPKISKTDILPIPENLTVKAFMTFGFAFVDPIIGLRLRYFGKIKGFEFYGSQNSDFEPHMGPYAQTGTHTGSDSALYLDTDPFVLDLRLVGRKLEKVYARVSGTATSGSATTTLKDDTDPFTSAMVGRTIRNLTDESGGTIATFVDTDEITTTLTGGAENEWDVGDSYLILNEEATILSYRPANPRYQILATGLTWDTGDSWIIKNYPTNRLFSFGPLAVFLKRPRSTYYVMARTVGKTENVYSPYCSNVEGVDTDRPPTPENFTVEQITKIGGNVIYWDKASGNPRVDLLAKWDKLEGDTGVKDYDIDYWIEGKDLS